MTRLLVLPRDRGNADPWKAWESDETVSHASHRPWKSLWRFHTFPPPRRRRDIFLPCSAGQEIRGPLIREPTRCHASTALHVERHFRYFSYSLFTTVGTLAGSICIRRSFNAPLHRGYTETRVLKVVCFFKSWKITSTSAGVNLFTIEV